MLGATLREHLLARGYRVIWWDGKCYIFSSVGNLIGTGQTLDDAWEAVSTKLVNNLMALLDEPEDEE